MAILCTLGNQDSVSHADFQQIREVSNPHVDSSYTYVDYYRNRHKL